MTDIKIENGGAALTPTNCDEVRLTGTEAVVQRIKIALSLKKGKFPYDKSMGISDAELDLSKERDVKTLEMLINEAICDIWDCKGKILSLNTESMTADMLFIFSDNTYRTEVNLVGKV